MPAPWSRLVDLLLTVLAVACVALALARVADNVSLHLPLQLVTSSAEEEALFSIWSQAHGQPVYTDPIAIPYTASYFNWLFYAVYGSMGAAGLRIFHLGDAWLPTICRLTTLTLAIGGGAAFFAALRGPDRALRPRHALILATLALFNPLSGLWLITARPDVGAISLEVAAVACFFRYLPARQWPWLLLTALCLYAAWGFKQTALSALGGIALTLLWRRDFRGLIILGGLGSTGVLAAALALGPHYRHGLYLSQAHAGGRPALGLEHLATAAGKMPLLLVALIFLPWFFFRRRKTFAGDPIFMTTTLTLVAAFLLGAVTSCKVGAADYYFIPLAVWSVLWVAQGVARRPPPAFNYALAAAAGVMIAGVVGIFFGWRGTLDCRPKTDPFGPLTRYLATRPGPVFVDATYGDLPWISPTAPHFVVAYLYHLDREARVPFERGGWQNLVAEGYFSTVVTSAETLPDENLSRGLRERYRLVRTAAGLDYFERK